MDTFQWKVLQKLASIDGKRGDVPEGTWVFGGGVESPCVFLYRTKIHKSSVWKNFKQIEEDLILKRHEYPFFSIKPALIKLFHGCVDLLVGLYAGR